MKNVRTIFYRYLNFLLIHIRCTCLNLFKNLYPMLFHIVYVFRRRRSVAASYLSILQIFQNTVDTPDTLILLTHSLWWFWRWWWHFTKILFFFESHCSFWWCDIWLRGLERFCFLSRNVFLDFGVQIVWLWCDFEFFFCKKRRVCVYGVVFGKLDYEFKI